MSSTDPDLADVYTLDINLDANFQTTGVDYQTNLSFDITVTDPCVTTVYDPFTLTDMVFEAGTTNLQDYTEPDHSAGTAVGDQTICGAIAYELVEIIGGVETPQTIGTLSAEGGTLKRMTLVTMDENDQGVHTMRLKLVLGRDYYPTYDAPDFQVTIQQATCNCNLIVWDEPAEQFELVLQAYDIDIQLARAAVNADSEVAEPAIRSCSGASSCDKTSTVSLIIVGVGAIDADYMTFDDTTMVLSLAPTLSSQQGTY